MAAIKKVAKKEGKKKRTSIGLSVRSRPTNQNKRAGGHAKPYRGQRK